MRPIMQLIEWAILVFTEKCLPVFVIFTLWPNRRKCKLAVFTKLVVHGPPRNDIKAP